MEPTRSEKRSHSFDTWLALLAGDQVWNERPEDSPTLREQGLAGCMLAALTITLLMQWVALTSRVEFLSPAGLNSNDRNLVRIALGSLVAAALLAMRPARLMMDRRTATANFWWSIAWRGLAYVALIASSAALLPRARFLCAIPLGFVGGTDALLAMWTLGLSPHPMRWLKGAVFSALHFGALGALMGVAVFDPNGPTALTALSGYAAMWVGILVAGITVLLVNRFTTLVDEQRAANLERLRARERELRVHWLHDDILSEVRLATMRIDTEHGTAANTRRELQDLDHRLRLRQLDEQMRGGEPHLYEIIQPHIRRAQTLGVQIDRVPPLDRTERRVDGETARIVHRVISNLVSNAMNAGATTLGITIEEIQVSSDELLIAVTDDAGGFDLDAVPPGRGLDRLRRELGPAAVTRAPAAGGSTVMVTVPVVSARSSAGRATTLGRDMEDSTQ